MASILKVDKIQNTVGAAPTVADLGVNVTTTSMPAGSLVQTVKASSAGSAQGNTAITTNSTTFTTMDTFTITTSGSSQLICWMFHGQATRTTTNSNFRFRLDIDSVSTGLGNENNGQWYHEGYGLTAGSREAYQNYFGTNTLSAGSHEVKFMFAMYGGQDGTVKFQNIPIRYLIQEVKV